VLRKILQYLPFFLPFIGYAVYVIVARASGRDASWRGAPWLWLTAGGLFLTVVALLAFWALEPRTGTEGDYVPPRLEDGRVQPGQVVPSEGE
jgi:hypothetical protein